MNDDFNELDQNELDGSVEEMHSQRRIHANYLYFVNTGNFYRTHQFIREDLLLSIEDPSPHPLLRKFLIEIALSVRAWTTDPDYKKCLEPELRNPDLQERFSIAAEILDHWTDRKITKHINRELNK